MNKKLTTEPELTRWPSSSNITFNQAVVDEDLAKVRFLLKYGGHGIGLNDKNKHGLTPLQQSCLKGNLPLVTQLLDHGADMETRDEKGLTALHFAVLSNSPNVARFLIDSCADLTVMDSQGRLPIDIAPSVEMLVSLAKSMNEQGYEETASWYMEKWGLRAPRPDDYEGPSSPMSFYDDANSSDEASSQDISKMEDFP